MKKNLLVIRELYGNSQADVANNLCIPQTSYANYELGKTKKIPKDFIKKFAYHYRVHEAWLMGDDNPLDEFERRDREKLEEKLLVYSSEISEFLRLPTAFVEAALTGRVIASKELYYAIAQQYGMTIENTLQKKAHKDEVAALKAEIQELKADLKRRDRTIDNLHDQVADLKEELAAAK